MTRKEIIEGLQFTVDMFLLDPMTGELKEPRNKGDKITVDACRGAIELLRQEPCEDTKQKLIKDCQPPTDDWEQYADKLHDIAYKNGYEQAKKDLACKDAVSRQAVLNIAKSSKSNWIDRSF